MAMSYVALFFFKDDDGNFLLSLDIYTHTGVYQWTSFWCHVEEDSG